eukprot:scaffold62759_cov75-Cyclotella_meneghiniana.AAC.4
MDEIAKKPYLNNPSIINSSRYNRGNEQSGNAALNVARPKGVPSRLRILTIDVPQCKNATAGICEQPSKIFEGVVDPIFEDGVARSKRSDQTLLNETQTREERRELRRPIEQKSLAKMLYYCYERQSNSNTKNQDFDPVVGVEILESSMMNLNPNNIRRTYTSKSLRYDPGKYNDEVLLQRHETDSGIADVEEITEDIDHENEVIQKDNNSDKEDTRTAPWNQFAWIEEIHLRINGLIPFNAPVQRSSMMSFSIFGRAYQQTIPSSMSYLQRLFPWSLWGNRIKSVEGADGEGECSLFDSRINNFDAGSSRTKKLLNRASNKPHAVIADGAAMQRVPGSLRFLTKVCRDAGVPLYILNDPREWGRFSDRSFSTLDEAIIDLSRTVSDNIVSSAIELRQGNAFERGRLVGRWEKELEWQAKEAGRKTRQAWTDAKQRWKKERMEDWSELKEDELRDKLIEKKVLSVEIPGDLKVSPGLRDICHGCTKQNSASSCFEDS